jgi:formamidopyrimidine-DNA glycosylase
VPELPEVESARAVIERLALGREIVDVADADSYVCRPHRPGEIRAVLVGRSLTSVHRRGKSMWCDTSGPTLGLHLGMSGRVIVTDGDRYEVDGGDYWERGRKAGDHRFARFSLTFADGGFLMLVDPRRLSRVRLDPPVEKLGPDAREITPAQFRAMMARGTAPVKARLLDQEAVAGIGNLLADQALWQAKINPAQSIQDLSRSEVDRLLRAVRSAVESAVEGGGVHTLSVIAARATNGRCPRCRAPMHKGVVGGRTTWWCSREQALRNGAVEDRR